MPRHDANAEMSVLGSLLLRPNKFDDAARHIMSPAYFYDTRNRLIWSAISQMVLDGRPIDYTTLSAKLAPEIKDGKVNPEYFMELTDHVPSPEACEHYSEMVSEEWRARELALRSQELRDALDERRVESAREAWENFYGRAQAVFSEAGKEDDPSIDTLATELGALQPGSGWGTPWGIPELDRCFHEIAPGAILVLGGRPGHNKTALALQLIDSWLGRGKRILFHSLEMNWREINMRRLSRISMIPAWRIKRGSFYHRNRDDPGYDTQVEYAVRRIHKTEHLLTLNDTAALTPEQICLSVRMAHERAKIDFLVLDHFGLLRFNGRKEDRFLRDEGLQQIVAACKSRGIILLLLSQLNRSIEREERDPKLSDLREVGGLEEIATNVLFTVWPYKLNNDPVDEHHLKIFQLKSRDGNTGKIDIFINAETYTLGGGFQND